MGLTLNQWETTAMLWINDETSRLTDLCVCRGTAVPPCEGFHNDHEEFTKFQMLPWDRDKLVRQQEAFYELMSRYGVRLHFVPHSDDHPWQMYTRDTGFVIGRPDVFLPPARIARA